MDNFPILVLVNYWFLIHIWIVIVFIWLYRIRTTSVERRLLIILLWIISLEAFRTIFENLYHGVLQTSYLGLIPEQIQTFLTRPEITLAPQIINTLSSLIIIGILVWKWIPRQEENNEKQSGFLFRIRQFLEGKDITASNQ
jgi:glucan phosphoethanolaminetransferase (alkaline phosphatase superfamily)